MSMDNSIKVLTINGYKKLSDLHIGDKLCTVNNSDLGVAVGASAGVEEVSNLYKCTRCN